MVRNCAMNFLQRYDRQIFDGNDDKIDGNDKNINLVTSDKSN